MICGVNSRKIADGFFVLRLSLFFPSFSSSISKIHFHFCCCCCCYFLFLLLDIYKSSAYQFISWLSFHLCFSLTAQQKEGREEEYLSFIDDLIELLNVDWYERLWARGGRHEVDESAEKPTGLDGWRVRRRGASGGVHLESGDCFHRGCGHVGDVLQ